MRIEMLSFPIEALSIREEVFDCRQNTTTRGKTERVVEYIWFGIRDIPKEQFNDPKRTGGSTQRAECRPRF
jgi:hypothetical protein